MLRTLISKRYYSSNIPLISAPGVNKIYEKCLSRTDTQTFIPVELFREHKTTFDVDILRINQKDICGLLNQLPHNFFDPEGECFIYSIFDNQFRQWGDFTDSTRLLSMGYALGDVDDLTELFEFSHKLTAEVDDFGKVFPILRVNTIYSLPDFSIDIYC